MARHALETGGSFYLRHLNWIRNSGISSTDRVVYEHELLSRTLDSMLTIDQLNIPSLTGAELLVRRLQLLEEAQRISPQSPDYSSAAHFMGWAAMRGGGAIAPALRTHVADTLRGEAAVAKEVRKAREEMGRGGGPRGGLLPKKNQGRGSKDKGEVPEKPA